jgi:hypothetical protein
MVRLMGNGLDTTLTIWNTQKLQNYTFILPALPETLLFDPQGWVLKQIHVNFLGHLEGEIPEHFTVSQNYPNPFNLDTYITIALPQPGTVTVEIFNLLGQRVYSENKYYDQGYQTWYWNSRNTQGKELPSGLYLTRIGNGNNFFNRKIVLIR